VVFCHVVQPRSLEFPIPTRMPHRVAYDHCP
jgi:hypothetical protein